MRILLMFGFVALFVSACSASTDELQLEESGQVKEKVEQENEVDEETKTGLKEPVAELAAYENRSAHEWGEQVTGVKSRLKTEEQVIALTFDACGGPYGNEVDEELVSFLIEEEVQATLFVNERWIHHNEELFLALADNPLFQIENHGTAHVPLSINGRSAWGIDGTASPLEVKDEVMGNYETIKELTGHAPTLFRSGTAFYDEVAVEIVHELGFEVVNFDVLGDAGATFSKEQVHEALLSARNGSIVLLHMNQPTSGTAEGVKLGVRDLREKGYSFVQLAPYELE